MTQRTWVIDLPFTDCVDLQHLKLKGLGRCQRISRLSDCSALEPKAFRSSSKNKFDCLAAQHLNSLTWVVI
jgi:hypothetical protein